ncbi:signal recognition particle receptor subunit alpha-like [Senna tora]|uniref:Signal recognition particle receptor subunit alpha-like n=1 Tax=Senna tora TaxID=362788 RepID=A0A835CD96_9FABA|nr:signal recognition particle receptor subunit alpha-like [Senna tora]
MDVLGAPSHRVYSVLGGAQCNRWYNGDTEGNSKKQGQGQKSGYEGGSKKNSEGSLKNGGENASSNLGAFDVNRLQKLESKGGKKTDIVTKTSKEQPKKKMTKKNRVWDGSPPETKLDFTDSVKVRLKKMKWERTTSLMLVRRVGKPNLEKSDLEAALKALKDRLMTKNVIPIFEKGYEKDPAIVAKEAIQEASRNGSDVVLGFISKQGGSCSFNGLHFWSSNHVCWLWTIIYRSQEKDQLKCDG